MRDNKKDQLLGTLDLLVLRTLSTGGSMHGYAVSERIEQVSREVLRVEAGSLYPALHRMEEAGWITATWTITGNKRRARVYEITSQGRERLDEDERRWVAVNAAVLRALKHA